MYTLQQMKQESTDTKKYQLCICNTQHFLTPVEGNGENAANQVAVYILYTLQLLGKFMCFFNRITWFTSSNL